MPSISFSIFFWRDFEMPSSFATSSNVGKGVVIRTLLFTTRGYRSHGPLVKVLRQTTLGLKYYSEAWG